MDIQTLTTFFMWCTILNLAVLILSSIVCIFFADFSYRMNNRFFSISREQFNVVLVCFIALFKICVIVFFIVPYVALLIIGRVLKMQLELLIQKETACLSRLI
jgi:hypothetical protein